MGIDGDPSVHGVTPGVDADLPAIEVDVDAIDDFVALLHEEVAQNLRPYAEQVIDGHSSGVTFGQSSGSEPMRALRQDYYRCLYSGADGLRSYIDASEVLLGAAEKIAGLYRQSDAMAQARGQEVLAALGVAEREVNAGVQAAATTDAEHENARESRRTQR
jgi:hypothetical protein